ncbi:MAG: hypothetical protein JSU00_25735 [Acidobacteria bacterium]|nr:hypothetical protein [Acidobacteriota bacterium]
MRPRFAAGSSRTEQRLRRCIERLPPGYRAIWRLSELHELDNLAIARRLNLYLPVVRFRLRRARLMLRRLLREEFGDKVRLPRGKAPRT